MRTTDYIIYINFHSQCINKIQILKHETLHVYGIVTQSCLTPYCLLSLFWNGINVNNSKLLTILDYPPPVIELELDWLENGLKRRFFNQSNDNSMTGGG